jgi:hypothetical protein
MARLDRHAVLVAALFGSMAALSACAGSGGVDGGSSSVVRSGSAYGAYDRCRPGTCGDASNPISGTNAVVGPGPRGEEWHKGPRE